MTNTHTMADVGEPILWKKTWLWWNVFATRRNSLIFMLFISMDILISIILLFIEPYISLLNLILFTALLFFIWMFSHAGKGFISPWDLLKGRLNINNWKMTIKDDLINYQDFLTLTPNYLIYRELSNIDLKIPISDLDSQNEKNHEKMISKRDCDYLKIHLTNIEQLKIIGDFREYHLEIILKEPKTIRKIKTQMLTGEDLTQLLPILYQSPHLHTTNRTTSTEKSEFQDEDAPEKSKIQIIGGDSSGIVILLSFIFLFLFVFLK